MNYELFGRYVCYLALVFGLVVASSVFLIIVFDWSTDDTTRRVYGAILGVVLYQLAKVHDSQKTQRS